MALMKLEDIFGFYNKKKKDKKDCFQEKNQCQ